MHPGRNPILARAKARPGIEPSGEVTLSKWRFEPGSGERRYEIDVAKR